MHNRPHYATLLLEDYIALLHSATPKQAVVTTAISVFLEFAVAHYLMLLYERSRDVKLSLDRRLSYLKLHDRILDALKVAHVALPFIINKLLAWYYKKRPERLLDPKGGAHAFHILLGMLVGILCAYLVFKGRRSEIFSTEFKKYHLPNLWKLTTWIVWIGSAIRALILRYIPTAKAYTIEEYYAYVEKLEKEKPDTSHTFIHSALKRAIQVYTQKYTPTWNKLKVLIIPISFNLPLMNASVLSGKTIVVQITSPLVWQKLVTFDEMVAILLHELGHAHVSSLSIINLIVWGVAETIHAYIHHWMPLPASGAARLVSNIVGTIAHYRAEFIADSVATILGYGEHLRSAFKKLETFMLPILSKIPSPTHPTRGARIAVSKSVEEAARKLGRILDERVNQVLQQTSLKM